MSASAGSRAKESSDRQGSSLDRLKILEESQDKPKSSRERYAAMSSVPLFSEKDVDEMVAQFATSINLHFTKKAAEERADQISQSSSKQATSYTG
jgi:hypothetical protein